MINNSIFNPYCESMSETFRGKQLHSFIEGARGRDGGRAGALSDQ